MYETREEKRDIYQFAVDKHIPVAAHCIAKHHYINGIVHLTFPHRSTGWKSGVEMEVWKSGVEIFFHTTGWELCWNPLKSTENFMAQTNYPRKP